MDTLLDRSSSDARLPLYLIGNIPKIMLSKKLLRALIYVVAGIVSLAALFSYHGTRFTDHPNEDLVIGDIVSKEESPFYIVDIAFKKCWRSSSSCGITDNDTKNSPNVKWVRITKNLHMKNKLRWNFDLYNYYLFLKLVDSEKLKSDEYLYEHYNKKNKFISQISVYLESKISNKDQIPDRIIHEFNNKGEPFSEMIMQNFEYTKNKLLSFTLDSHSNEKRAEKGEDLKIPSLKQVADLGWVQKNHGLWVKFDTFDQTNSLQKINILFGEDAVDPRPDWYMIQNPLQVSQQTYKSFITLSNKKLAQRLTKNFSKKPILKIHPDGKYKILQVADLHFSNGYGECRDPFPAETAKDCKADPRSLQFIRQVLDMERPDLVILTGDQIFGETSPDAFSSLLKAVAIFIEYKIPYATNLGNHDDESSLTRQQVMEITASLPYSLSQLGPEDVSGIGNYYLTIQGPKSSNPAVLLWFLDTHKYSPTPKTNPGYDWIKENQLEWLENEYMDLSPLIASYSHIHLSMAFFHIPLPEYRNVKENNVVGSYKEGVTASSYNTGARSVLAKLGVSVVSVGHDHCNDYCLFDSLDGEIGHKNKDLWLCYAGAAGEGGYGGYGGTARRVRVFEIDTNSNSIFSWKRVETNANDVLDKQTLVDGGHAKL